MSAIETFRKTVEHAEKYEVGVTLSRGRGREILDEIEKLQAEAVTRQIVPVGSEVKTRSGVYPSIPYVKQADGTWKPKYTYDVEKGE